MPQSTFASVSPNKRDGPFQGECPTSSEVGAMGGKGDGERAPITLSSLGPRKTLTRHCSMYIKVCL